MKRRTDIDLTKMSQESQTLYLKYLVRDLSQALQDLVKDKSELNYTNMLIEHAIQADEDLTVIINTKQGSHNETI
jgi:hypothetical protein